VEYRAGSSWRRLFTVTTDARGAFTRAVAFRSGRRYRLVWTSPAGETMRGTTTSVYKR
jgi:hypothetical protein